MFPESKQLRLRFTTVNDLEFVCRLESDNENARYIIPWPKEKHKESLENKDMLHLIIEEKNNSKPAGYIILAGLANPNKSIELIRITIGNKGKGFGKEALQLMKEWAFHTFGAHRLWLDVKTDNARAFHLYKKQGFILEGTLRECLKGENGYESLHVLSILHNEFMTNNQH